MIRTRNVKRFVLAAAVLVALNAAAGIPEVDEAMSRQDFEKAIAVLRPLLEKGDPDAYMHMAMMLILGQGAMPEPQRGLQLLEMAAAKGHVESMYLLGYLHISGAAIPKDPGQAKKWLDKAAERGWPQAMRDLGGMYLLGDGAPKDEPQALIWFKKAAEAGLADAMLRTALMLKDGIGVSKNPAEAAQWFERVLKADPPDANPAPQNATNPQARKKGALAAVAALHLGAMHLSGDGAPKDPAKGRAYVEQSAALGDPRAKQVMRDLFGVAVP